VYAPFEDVHASGSVLTALMLFAISKVFWGRDRRTWLIATILTGGLLAFSYSRGAWLGALLGMSLLAAIRLPMRSSLALATAGFVSFLLLFLSALKFELVNPHLSRLSSFVRVDRWTQTESVRLQLYESAIRMIEARPWFGHGPGSSYLLSGQFDGRGSDDPHFLHNSVLQLAAEAGLPAGLFLILVLGIVVIRAIPVARSRTVVSANTCALTVGCVGYLGTQLTANAINIYPTQVFFFWPLFAMLWLSTTHCCEKRTQALPPTTAV
jgi:O-antigen ligase